MNETKNHGHKLLIWGSVVGVFAVLIVVFLYWHKHNTVTTTIVTPASATTQSNQPMNGDAKTTNPYNGPSGPTTSATTAPSAAHGSCSKLVLSKGESDGTAGTTYTHLVITNNDTSSCTISGYPKVVMNDTMIALTAQKNPIYTDANVVLAPNGGRAYVLVAIPDPANVDAAKVKCTNASMDNLFMTLPGESAAIATQFRVSACQGYSASAFHVGT